MTMPYSISLIAAAAAGYIEMRQDQLLVTVAFILVVGVVIGVMWPKNSWAYGIILGLGVPVAYLLAAAGAWHPVSTAHPSVWVTFIALLPGVTATVTGAMLRSAYLQGKN